MKDKLLSLHKNSYSPYSNFAVSAIVVMTDGTEFNGVNVENAAYGAAICAERMNKRASVCILEKNRDILRKVAASGNGRCNISNSRTKYSREIQDFFASVGVFFAEEDEGRLYPYNRSSQAVIDALKIQLEKNNVDIFTKAEVSSVEPSSTIMISKFS